MSGHKNHLSINEHDKFFEQYMNESLRLEEVKIKKKEGGGSITDKQESIIKYNTDRKGAILKTYVIKSMANLTYFFNFINEHPELNFDKDIEKIMGLNEAFNLMNMPIDSKKAPFTRMLREFIGLQYSDTPPRFGYRIRLLRIMQFLIRYKADWIGRNLNYPKFPTLNDYEMLAMMISDLRRAETWIGYLDQSISKVSDKEGKPKPKSNAKTVISKSEYSKELDETVREQFKHSKKT